MKKGKLLFRITFLDIYENGIKPSRIAYMIVNFIPYEKIVKIYPFYNDKNYHTGEYVFVYLRKNQYEIEKCHSLGGIKGSRFSIKLPNHNFQRVCKIFEEKMGKRFEEVYNKNIVLKERPGYFFSSGFDLYDLKK